MQTDKDLTYSNSGVLQPVDSTTTAIPPSMDIPPDFIEDMKNLVHPVMYHENLILAEENKALKEQHEKDIEYKDTCADLSVELKQYKRKLREAQDTIRQLQGNNTTNLPNEKRPYRYDITDFGEGATASDVAYFFDTIVWIVNEKTITDEYMFDSSMVIVPFYIMFTSSTKFVNTKWHYTGTLIDFCSYWNNNVVPYVEGKDRQQAFTCSYKTVKAECNKEPWKDCRPGSWSMKLNNWKRGSKIILKRAINIKARLENKLKITS